MRALALLLAGLAVSANAQSGTLAVYVDGLRAARGGDVVLRLYRSERGFPSDRDLAAREIRQPVTGTTATVLLDDVPEGAVAAVAFHDEDGDGRVRLRADGSPRDGVSTARWPGGEAPHFARSAVSVAEGAVTVARLRLWYPDDR